eukprot:scaffold7433_cov72-Skeletonema_dohrnii-CCMP3373.AAC.1
MKNSYKELRYRCWSIQTKKGLGHSYAWNMKGLQFIKQAADQRVPAEALLLMALKGFGCRSRIHRRTKYFLGLVYDRPNNENMNLHYTATLAASKGDAKACGMLGEYFLTKSLILAKYYSEKS